LDTSIHQKIVSNVQLIKSELDEMWSFIQKKQWIWIAQCRQTRQVIAFHIEERGRADAKELWGNILIASSLPTMIGFSKIEITFKCLSNFLVVFD